MPLIAFDFRRHSLDNVNPDEDVSTDGFLNVGLNSQAIPVLNSKDANSSPERELTNQFRTNPLENGENQLI